MTNLILDIGNTRSKLFVVSDGKVIYKTAVELIASELLSSLCQQYNVDAAIASVVGHQPDFQTLLPEKTFKNFHQLSHHSKLPIHIDYETPETLGMDRVAAIVGAQELNQGGPFVVVDAGSCITIDLLDDKDIYRGGAILPGLQMRFRALHDYTAALPLITLTDDEMAGFSQTSPVGKSTRGSIVAGVCNASLLEIEGFMTEYRKEFPAIKLFLTGGDAVFFAKRLFFPNFAVSDLIALGLDKILKMNTEN